MPLFHKQKILDQGRTTEVAHVVRKSDKAEFAMKIMKRDDRWNPHLFKQEYTFLSMFSHPNIVGFRD